MIKLAVVHSNGNSFGAAHLEPINKLENLTRNEGGGMKRVGPSGDSFLLFCSTTILKLCVLLWP